VYTDPNAPTADQITNALAGSGLDQAAQDRINKAFWDNYNAQTSSPPGTIIYSGNPGVTGGIG